MLLLLYITGFSAFAHNGNVVRLTTGDWKPYTSSDAPGGLVEKVVISAFKTQYYDVEIEYMPWKRSAKSVEKTHADATFPWYSSEERREKFVFSKNPLMHMDTLMFHHISVDLKWDAISDLGNYKIGSVSGFYSTKLLAENGVAVIESTSTEETIQKLFYKRVDAIPVAREVGLHLINTMPYVDPEMIKIDDKPLISNPLFILFSKTPRGKHLSQVFDRGLKVIKDSGCYDLLMSGQSCDSLGLKTKP